MSIPKIIHYCWLSGEEFPADIKECIDSWKNILPDYKIKLWDTHNFDSNICKYTKQALELKKYAFVSDYVRLYALYNEGGIYLDTDVKVIKSFDDLLNNRAFTGFESGGRIAAWLFASEAKNPLFKELLDHYNDLEFYDSNGRVDLTPNTVPVTKTLVKHGLKPVNEIQKLDNITVYPEDYFCAKNPWTNVTDITENTYTVHFFKGAWNDAAGKDMPFIGKTNIFVGQFFKWLSENNLEQKKLIIYGAGVVGRNVLEQIHIQNPDKNIDAIMVSKKDNDWQQIDGISVVEAGNFDKAIKDDYVVCIATTPKYHDEIKQSLVNNGFEHYYLLGETN